MMDGAGRVRPYWRSALLLSKAKDNQGSTAIGPVLRLFDARFTLDDVRRMPPSAGSG